MNPELEDLFVDTDTFLTQEESYLLMDISHQGHWKKIPGGPPSHRADAIIDKLAQKGILGIYPCHDGNYYFIKNHINCRPITVEFHAYFAKLAKNDSGQTQYINEEEKDKAAFSRGFISRWIYLQKTIDDTTHRHFLTLFINRASYVMSVPEFLIGKFQKEIDKTGMVYRILTPEYTVVSCPFCRYKFQSKDNYNEVCHCPECGKNVLIR